MSFMDPLSPYDHAASHRAPTWGADTEIDSRELRILASRFLAHHGSRLTQARERLAPRQRLVLDVLPLLLHCNHPALPGYSGTRTPCGIEAYEPDELAKTAARSIAKSYRARRFAQLERSLQGLYLMGSSGSVAHSRLSDVDLWICCDESLHDGLSGKVALITRWAREQGLTLQPFLVDADRFRTLGQVKGCATPMLLLDEFYRSAIHLAGRLPLWWLVPSTTANEYTILTDRLLTCRFVAADGFIDFGPVIGTSSSACTDASPLPMGELAHAVVTELNRSLRTPHKSLLKLKLLKAYSSNGQDLLSARYKQRIQDGDTAPLRLDPYVLLHERVDDYLKDTGTDSERRLYRDFLVRKVAVQTRMSLQAMNRLFGDWGYTTADLARLRHPEQRSLAELLTEQQDIVGQWQEGLELAERLVAAASAADAELGWLIQTQLNAARHRINTITTHLDDAACIPRLVPALVPPNYRASVAARWQRGHWLVRDHHVVVYSCRTLAELACWAEVNSIGSLTLPPPQLVNFQQLRVAFHHTSRPVLALINADELQHQSQHEGYPADAEVISHHSDPLAYGGLKNLELKALDIATRQSHGRWQLMRAEPANLLTSMLELLALPAARVSWQVIGGRRRFAFMTRLRAIHAEAQQVLAIDGSRFSLPWGGETVQLTSRYGRLIQD